MNPTENIFAIAGNAEYDSICKNARDYVRSIGVEHQNSGSRIEVIAAYLTACGGAGLGVVPDPVAAAFINAIAAWRDKYLSPKLASVHSIAGR